MSNYSLIIGQIDGINGIDWIEGPSSLPIIIPQKKKGRKSKNDKLLELEEQERINKEKRFPTLNQKIFEVVKINKMDYYYDADFNILYDEFISPVGFKQNMDTKDFIFYQNTKDIIEQIKLDKLVMNKFT